MGGTAYLSLESPDEPFLHGVKFTAMPPTKRFRDMEQLSGGEKVMSPPGHPRILECLQCCPCTTFWHAWPHVCLLHERILCRISPHLIDNTCEGCEHAPGVA